MPTIVMSKLGSKIDPADRKKAMAFLLKLGENDATAGLHIEPITNSADPRVRTGRVDQGLRAVLFKIPGEQDTIYVFHGVWEHDKAIEVAKKTVLSVNPVNGVTELRTVDPSSEAPAPQPTVQPPVQPPAPPAVPPVAPPAVPLLVGLGITLDDLVDV